MKNFLKVLAFMGAASMAYAAPITCLSGGVDQPTILSGGINVGPVTFTCSPGGNNVDLDGLFITGVTLNLTGAMSNEFMGATPISDGMVDGDNVSFKLTMQGGPGGAMTINYKGMIHGDELHVTSTIEGAPPGGGPAEQTFVATRAK